MASRKVEEMAVIGQDGSGYRRLSSSSTATDPSPSEIEMMRGNTVVHYHPDRYLAAGAVLRNSSFSPEDVALLLTSEAKQFRLVTSEYRFFLEVKPGLTPSGSASQVRKIAQAIKKAYSKRILLEQREAANKLRQARRLDRMTEEYVKREVASQRGDIMHRALSHIADMRGLRYRREPIHER